MALGVREASVGKPAIAIDEITTWHEEVDVVVAGSGAAGLVAALVAADSGARVGVLEKAGFVGGTTLKSAGGMWVPNNPHMSALGIEDSFEAAIAYIARTARPERYRADAPHAGLPEWEYDLLKAIYEAGPRALASLEQMGGLLTMPLADLPNYYTEVAEDTVRFGRCLCPRTPSGDPADGPEMVEQLWTAASSRGARMLLEHRVVSAVVEPSGAVAGVIAETPRGRAAIRARRAVVFATGGFTHNRDLRESHLPGPIFGGCAAVANEGDFVPIAQTLGAAMRNMNQAWNAPLVLERALSGDPALRSSFNLVGDSILAVNRYGRRAMNEKAVYHEIVFAMFGWDGVRCEYPNLLMFPLWDERTMVRYGGTPYDGGLIPGPNDDSSHLITGMTLEELADALARRLETLAEATGGVSLAAGFVDQLRATVARFNVYAESGQDPEFGRGESLIERRMHELNVSAVELGTASPSAAAAVDSRAGAAEDPARTNPTMHPLADAGPYYASIIGPGTLDTKGGPMVSRWGQVLDHSGRPVERLYAVGNCAASPSGRGYWGAGGTIGPMVVLAWLAGQHVSSGGISDTI